MDASGNPVVSAWVLDAPDSPNGHLGMLRCNDPDCDGNSGQYSSSAIDDRVYPVISYYEGDNANLKLLRCDTPTCAPPVDPEAMFVVEPLEGRPPRTAHFTQKSTVMAVDRQKRCETWCRSRRNPSPISRHHRQ
ncbi:MAG: hypothetical protein ACK2UT_10340 [Candidatus Promineifilaceae bacterium]